MRKDWPVKGQTIAFRGLLQTMSRSGVFSYE